MTIGDKLFVADKPTLDQVKALIGTANPASGDLLTLFKGLKLISDYVDTLETKLGVNTDVAGTGTIFARLAQIAGYTDQVEAYVDTVEGVLATLLGYTDTLETALGQTGDAANASGSANAKLAYLIAVGQKARGAVRSQTDITSAAYINALNISGKGSFKALDIWNGTGNSINNAKVFIDGTQVLAGQWTQASTPSSVHEFLDAGAMQNVDTYSGGFQSESSANSSVGHIWDLEFKTSLQIQAKTSAGTLSVTPYYSLE